MLNFSVFPVEYDIEVGVKNIFSPFCELGIFFVFAHLIRYEFSILH
jgi:hypothetical protein